MPDFKYKPCEYTIKATALNISPLLFNKNISAFYVKTSLEINDDQLQSICKQVNLSTTTKIFTTKEFINLIDYAIKANLITYKKENIKEIYFKN